MNLLENFRILDIIDILLVACLLYYLYKLVKGTVAINIFFGICIIWVIWKITQLLQMEMLSSILGQFIGAGMFALIVVFQQEIRKFLLVIGSTKLDRRSGFLKHIKFLQNDQRQTSTKVEEIISACESMALTRTGALIVIGRNSSLEFVKNTGDEMQIEVNKPILESIFYKNSTLHDGAAVIEENKITATRAILPVSNERNIPLRFGLRHRAAVGISEKTDAVVLVVSEETGQISYIKDGDFEMFKNNDELIAMLQEDLR